MSIKTESYLSKLMDLSSQTETKPDSSLKDQTKCLPSFLLTDDLDEVNTNEDTKKLSAPKRSQNQKSKFFSSENMVTDYQRQMMINSQVKSQFNKQIIYPNTQDENMGYYSPMNGYGYQQSGFPYTLHPPQPGTFMHNPSSFNYSPVNNINNLSFQINNTVIPRINSFNFVPPINTNVMLHTPTNRIQSQNNFFCNISQNNTISIPRMKKKSISPSKRGKKKAPKKSTADSETLSISNILSLNENELYSFIITQKGSRDIQSILKKVTEADVDALISKLTSHFSDIMVDKYCIRYSDESVVNKIYNDIITTGKLGSMLNNTYGNFVIEKLIARLSKEEKDELIKEITKLGKEKNLSNTIMNLLYK